MPPRGHKKVQNLHFCASPPPILCTKLKSTKGISRSNGFVSRQDGLMMSQCPPPSAGAQGSQSSTQSYRNRMELVKTRVSRLSSHVMIGQIQAVCPNSHDSRGFPALFQLDPPCLPPVPVRILCWLRVPGFSTRFWCPGWPWNSGSSRMQ